MISGSDLGSRNNIPADPILKNDGTTLTNLEVLEVGKLNLKSISDDMFLLIFTINISDEISFACVSDSGSSLFYFILFDNAGNITKKIDSNYIVDYYNNVELNGNSHSNRYPMYGHRKHDYDSDGNIVGIYIFGYVYGYVSSYNRPAKTISTYISITEDNIEYVESNVIWEGLLSSDYAMIPLSNMVNYSQDASKYPEYSLIILENQHSFMKYNNDNDTNVYRFGNDAMLKTGFCLINNEIVYALDNNTIPNLHTYRIDLDNDMNTIIPAINSVNIVSLLNIQDDYPSFSRIQIINLDFVSTYKLGIFIAIEGAGVVGFDVVYYILDIDNNNIENISYNGNRTLSTENTNRYVEFLNYSYPDFLDENWLAFSSPMLSATGKTIDHPYIYTVMLDLCYADDLENNDNIRAMSLQLGILKVEDDAITTEYRNVEYEDEFIINEYFYMILGIVYDNGLLLVSYVYGQNGSNEAEFGVKIYRIRPCRNKFKCEDTYLNNNKTEDNL